MTRQPTILVAGATGMLGWQIAEQLIARGARVRALVREGSDATKRSALDALSPGGLEIVGGDLRDPVDRLARAVEGAEVIVSAVQGGPDVIVEGQTNLVRAAEKAGVARMIPSDFAIDLFRLDYGDNDFLDLRKRANEAFAGSPVKPTSVLNGAFIDVMVNPFLQVLDWQAGTFSYWGDGEQPSDFTSVADTAAYTAAAALDPGVAGRPVRVAGEVLTMRQFHAALEAGSGRKLEARRMGSVDELKAEIDRRKREAPQGPGHTPQPMGYVPLQYHWAMVSGKAKLEPLDNHRYPEIRPMGVERFVREGIASGALRV